MNFIKKNKMGICIGIAAILFLVLVAFFIKSLLPIGKTPWGNRLDGIEEHQIANQDIDKIKESIKATGIVRDVSYKNTGRILRFIIYVNDDVERKSAIALVSNITSVISSEDQSYYDIEVMFDKDSEDDAYPIIGYKHKTSNSFSFSK